MNYYKFLLEDSSFDYEILLEMFCGALFIFFSIEISKEFFRRLLRKKKK